MSKDIEPINGWKFTCKPTAWNHPQKTLKLYKFQREVLKQMLRKIKGIHTP